MNLSVPSRGSRPNRPPRRSAGSPRPPDTPPPGAGRGHAPGRRTPSRRDAGRFGSLLLRAAAGLLVAASPVLLAEAALALLGSGGSLVERYFAFVPDFYGSADRHDHALEAIGGGAGATAGGTSAEGRGGSDPAARSDDAGGTPFRIVVAGASVVAGFPWEARDAFPARLEEALQTLFPGQPWDVVAAGGNGWCSHHLRALFDPAIEDALGGGGTGVLVLYTGHNELLDRTQLPVPWTVRPAMEPLFRVLLHTRIFGRIQLGLRGAPGEWFRTRPTPESDQLPDPAALDRHPLDRPITANLPIRPWERRIHEERYRRNLEALAGAAGARGVPVVIATVAANLRDAEPMRSEPSRRLAPEDERRLREEVAAAWQALGKKAAARNGGPVAAGAEDDAGALAHADAALAIDDGYAAAWFLRGRALLALGRDAEAARAFRLARDRDAAPVRAPSTMAAIAREVARERGVALWDAAQALAAASRAGSPGSEWILDTVHPTVEGHRLLALSLLDRLLEERLLPLPAPSREGRDGAAPLASGEGGPGGASARLAAALADPAGPAAQALLPIPREGDDPEELRVTGDEAVVSDASLALVFGNPGACERWLDRIPAAASLTQRHYRLALALRAILAKDRGDLAFVEAARRRMLEESPRIRSRPREAGIRKVLGIRPAAHLREAEGWTKAKPPR